MELCEIELLTARWWFREASPDLIIGSSRSRVTISSTSMAVTSSIFMSSLFVMMEALAAFIYCFELVELRIEFLVVLLGRPNIIYD